MVTTIIGISAAASAFLIWLVFKHNPSDPTNSHLLFLPALNAMLNAACTVALLVGFRHIWHGRVVQHRNAMFTAFVFSSLFLVSYIANHAPPRRYHLPDIASNGSLRLPVGAAQPRTSSSRWLRCR